jgi:hypothetical protein
MAPAYPVTFEADGPASQNRLSVFFRIFLAIPHFILSQQALSPAIFVLSVFAWFTILFTGRVPAKMLHLLAGLLKYQIRMYAYALLVTGAYPPFSLDDEDGYPVRLRIEERPEGRNRLTAFFRVILAIPHFIILFFLAIALFVIVIIVWFAALFTGSVPRGLHGFIAGVLRWSARVSAYTYLLVDEYPPFSLD